MKFCQPFVKLDTPFLQYYRKLCEIDMAIQKVEETGVTGIVATAPTKILR